MLVRALLYSLSSSSASFFTAIPFLGVFVFGLALFLSIIGIVSALRAQEYYQFPLLGALSEKLTFL